MTHKLKSKLDSNAIILQKIIAAYTPFHYYDIDLSKKIKDKYIASELKESFCNDILNAWKYLDGTILINEMFEELETGNDILKILKYVQ